ncbi:MAG TPA: methyltransferase domain-containing protein [Clostridia bacterium]
MSDILELRRKLINELLPFTGANSDGVSNQVLLENYVEKVEEVALLKILGEISDNPSMTVEDLYDNMGENYEVAFADRRHIEKSLKLIAEQNSFEVAADLGCGTGMSTKPLLSIAKQVIALDISSVMLDLAQKRLGDENVRYIQADFIKKIPLEDNSVDFIFSVGATRHIPNGSEESFFSECARILSPGGKMLVTFVTPAEGEAGILDKALQGYMNAHGISDRRFHEDQVIKYCNDNGFIIEDIQRETSKYLYGKLFVIARRADS